MWEKMFVLAMAWNVPSFFTGCTWKGGGEIPSRLCVKFVSVRDVCSHSCTPVLMLVCHAHVSCLKPQDLTQL